MNGAFEELMARLDLVAVEAGRRSAEIESARSLPRDLVEALIDTGVFRLTVPMAYGGLDAGPSALIRVVRSLASRDGSTGWVVMSALVAAADAARLPRHHAATVLGDPRAVVVGHRGPGGTGHLTADGGLLVSGRWSWGSGVAVASWVEAGVRVDGEPSDGEPGGHRLVRGFFRRDQVVALDTWHAVGLCGTGSTDFEVIEAFLPEGRWITGDDDVADDEAPHGDGDPTATTTDDLFAIGAAAVAIGLAARALVETGPDRRPTGPGPSPAPEAVSWRADRARLGAALAAADALLDRAVAGLAVDGAPPGGPVPSAGIGAAAVNAVEVAVAVVERCYRSGGPGAVLHASPLQRILRDVQVVAQHPAVSPVRWERLGSPVDRSP